MTELEFNMLKPKKRSKLRLKAGKLYYMGKRYLWWAFGKHKFAKELTGKKLSCIETSHKTPTLRKLKDVDMYLQHNKVTNLKIAVEKLNGLIIRPGETFSYWKLIGKPTKKKGYIEGMILYSGQFKPGIGGGLCQLSNMIFWMAIHTPLTITERYRHSFDVFPDSNRTQPFGSGATCVYNYRDLMIKNNTNHPYQLCLEVTDTYLKGEFRTDIVPDYYYKIYEKDCNINLEFWGGYTRHNSIWRKKISLDDEVLNDEFVVDNHAIMMYNPLLENNNDKQK